MDESAAEATGLRAGTPIVAGGGDQAANAVGVGVIGPGEMALSLGTSGVVFAATDRPLREPHGIVHAFCHAVPDRWHMMSVMLSAAGSLRWFRDALAPGVDFGTLVERASGVDAAGDGLFFLPYLTGERSPHPDPYARGAFVGLTLSHDERHLTRAVIEGVAFGLRDGLDLMSAAGIPRPSRIRASGGGIASPLWRSILADVLEAEIATVSTTEGAASGAALLAAVGAGWFADVETATTTLVRVTPVAAPGPDVEVYRAAHERFRALYPALAPTFERPASSRQIGLGRPNWSAAELDLGLVLLGDLAGLLAQDDHPEDVVGGRREPLSTVSTMRPWYITLIRSDRSNTSWMSWLMRKMPIPSSFSCRTRFLTWAVSAGPSAAVGSSMIRILALK